MIYRRSTRSRSLLTRRTLLLAAVACLAAALAGCGSGGALGSSKGLRIVAAENFWGSIASQLAGTKASVQSIIVNPAQDPHSYEPLPGDARTLATAQLVIVNGVGYDPWAPKLLAAEPAAGRQTLDVGALFGLHEGDNPHRWYDPPQVEAVARAITADLIRLDPADRRYFQQQLLTFETRRLASYHALIDRIHARYAGVPVGASESIFALLSPSLGLHLMTPPSFMKAISEGTDVTAHDAIATESQIVHHQIKVWVYNSQNATPQIQHLNQLARANHIPIATVTETLSPAGDSFEQWQVTELQGIAAALRAATGR